VIWLLERMSLSFTLFAGHLVIDSERQSWNLSGSVVPVWNKRISLILTLYEWTCRFISEFSSPPSKDFMKKEIISYFDNDWLTKTKTLQSSRICALEMFSGWQSKKLKIHTVLSANLVNLQGCGDLRKEFRTKFNLRSIDRIDNSDEITDEIITPTNYQINGKNGKYT
jgi:hypothetical protein